MKSLSYIDQLKSKVSLFRFAMICMVAMTGINFMQASVCMNDKTTVLVPPGMTGQGRVSRHKADDDYLRMMARYTTGLAFNYTPSTARGQFAELLELFHTDAYPEMRSAYETMAEQVEVANITQSFFVQEEIQVAEDVITIKGTLHQSLAGQEQKPAAADIKLRYQMINGRFAVKELWNDKRD